MYRCSHLTLALAGMKKLQRRAAAVLNFRHNDVDLKILRGKTNFFAGSCLTAEIYSFGQLYFPYVAGKCNVKGIPAPVFLY